MFLIITFSTRYRRINNKFHNNFMDLITAIIMLIILLSIFALSMTITHPDQPLRIPSLEEHSPPKLGELNPPDHVVPIPVSHVIDISDETKEYGSQYQTIIKFMQHYFSAKEYEGDDEKDSFAIKKILSEFAPLRSSQDIENFLKANDYSEFMAKGTLEDLNMMIKKWETSATRVHLELRMELEAVTSLHLYTRMVIEQDQNTEDFGQRATTNFPDDQKKFIGKVNVTFAGEGVDHGDKPHDIHEAVKMIDQAKKLIEERLEVETLFVRAIKQLSRIVRANIERINVHYNKNE